MLISHSVKLNEGNFLHILLSVEFSLMKENVEISLMKESVRFSSMKETVEFFLMKERIFFGKGECSIILDEGECSDGDRYGKECFVFLYYIAKNYRNL